MGDLSAGRSYIEDNWPRNSPEDESSDDAVSGPSDNRLGDLRILLDSYGHKLALGKPRQPIRDLGSADGDSSMAGTRKVPPRTGRSMMAAESMAQMLGRIQAMVESMDDRSREEREESRERGKKMDALLARMSSFDSRLNDVARDLGDQLKDQNRSSTALDERLTKALADARQSLAASLELVTTNVKTLQAQQETLSVRVGKITDQTDTIQADQIKLRQDVSDVKTDTTRLQRSIAPIDAIRTKTLALWAILLSVGGVAFIAIFQGAATGFINHIMSFWSH